MLHGPRYYRMIRDGIKEDLVKNGLSKSEANQHASTLSHEKIDTATMQCGIKGSLGDGHILSWIKDHREQILAVIKLLVSVILMFIKSQEVPTTEAVVVEDVIPLAQAVEEDT